MKFQFIDFYLKYSFSCLDNKKRQHRYFTCKLCGIQYRSDHEKTHLESYICLDLHQQKILQDRLEDINALQRKIEENKQNNNYGGVMNQLNPDKDNEVESL